MLGLDKAFLQQARETCAALLQENTRPTYTCFTAAAEAFSAPTSLGGANGDAGTGSGGGGSSPANARPAVAAAVPALNQPNHGNSNVAAATPAVSADTAATPGRLGDDEGGGAQNATVAASDGRTRQGAGAGVPQPPSPSTAVFVEAMRLLEASVSVAQVSLRVTDAAYWNAANVTYRVTGGGPQAGGASVPPAAAREGDQGLGPHPDGERQPPHVDGAAARGDADADDNANANATPPAPPASRPGGAGNAVGGAVGDRGVAAAGVGSDGGAGESKAADVTAETLRWIVLAGDAACGRPFYLGSTLNAHFQDAMTLV